jgi:hypothetical protein
MSAHPRKWKSLPQTVSSVSCHRLKSRHYALRLEGGGYRRDHLQKEVSQPAASKGTGMRLVIDKQPEGTHSTNLADAVVMAYWPVVNSM